MEEECNLLQFLSINIFEANLTQRRFFRTLSLPHLQRKITYVWYEHITSKYYNYEFFVKGRVVSDTD